MVIVPLGLLVALAIVQIARMVDSVAGWVRSTDLNTLGDKTLHLVNELLARVPFVHVTVSAEALRKAIVTASQNIGHWLLEVLQNTAGSLATTITSAIIFFYVFLALLVNQEKLRTLIAQLNPLGEEATDLYLRKMGSMVRGTVNGQFVIAFCQGVAGAASIYIAGFHHGFFIFAILLTALSIIPLGGGIVTIPFGIGMMFFGQYRRRRVRGALSPHRGHQYRQLPATRSGAARRPAELGADVAFGVRGYQDVRPVGHHHRPGADDHHRHHDRRLPCGVQGHRDAELKWWRTNPFAQLVSRRRAASGRPTQAPKSAAR